MSNGVLGVTNQGQVIVLLCPEGQALTNSHIPSNLGKYPIEENYLPLYLYKYMHWKDDSSNFHYIVEVYTSHCAK